MATERAKPGKRRWRWILALTLLGFPHAGAGCVAGDSSGPSCGRAGSLCQTGADCCSGSCRCVDMSAYCRKCD